MKSINVDISSFEKTIDRYVKKVAAKTAGIIADEMTAEATDAILRFYADYKPKVYRRHYRNFIWHSFKRYYSNPHSVIFTGGVELTPDALEDIYQDSPREVFDTVYQGFHGPASLMSFGYDSVLQAPASFQGIDRMNPSPMELLIKKREGIENHIQFYINRAQMEVT